MTLTEHLAELRRRLVISLVAVTVGVTVAFFLSKQIIHFLVTYYTSATNGQKDALIFLGPADAFLIRLKIATYAGIVLALPVWLFQFWRFVTPGLQPRSGTRSRSSSRRCCCSRSAGSSRCRCSTRH